MENDTKQLDNRNSMSNSNNNRNSMVKMQQGEKTVKNEIYQTYL